MTRARIIAYVAVALALCGAFAAGRHSRRVETRDVVRTVTVDRDVVRTQVVHDVQTVHDVATKTNTVTVTRWRTVAGVPEVTATTTDLSTTEVHEAAHDGTVATRIAEHEASTARVEEHQRIEGQRPQWSVAVLGGAQITGGRLLPAPWVVGALVERRIAGPVSAGLWGTSGGAGGLSVRIEF